MPHASAVPHQETQSYPRTHTHTLIHPYYTVCIGLLSQLSGAKARQHACNSHGCIRAQGLRFTAAAERERRRREAETERVSSHLVVLKTPGMLLL